MVDFSHSDGEEVAVFGGALAHIGHVSEAEHVTQIRCTAWYVEYRRDTE